MSVWLIDVAAAVGCVLIGTTAGWWLRGRWQIALSWPKPKKVAEDALGDLHQVAESVQACIQEHTECIQAIEAELCETAAHEPAVLQAAVTSIRDANQQVCSEFTQLREDLDNQAAAINHTLDYSRTLLLTSLSLDHQKHQYEKVLESLQLLAVEVARDMDGCKHKLRNISAAMDTPVGSADDVTGAITKILDATDSVRQRIESAEQMLEKQAEMVEMQAVLGHTDLLTTLPNRRAFEAELQRLVAEYQDKRQPFAVMLVDLDEFKQINTDYGHLGGDVVLRGIADLLKNNLRGGDVVARCGGEEFALLMVDTTLAQSLPLAERMRTTIENAQHSYGSRGLRVTASLGTAQFIRGEDPSQTQQRARQALAAAKQHGGNATYWHDGREIHPVHEVHLQTVEAVVTPPPTRPGPIATPIDPNAATREKDEDCVVVRPGGSGAKFVAMSGRSLFISNLKRRIDDWYGGGPAVSVILMRIDQYAELNSRFGPPANDFLRNVIGRLLEASSRSIDERCHYDEHTFALLIVGCDGFTAKRIAKRLRSQVGQCKLRLDKEIWELSATIGAAQCCEGKTAMDLLLMAEEALQQATMLGGNMLCMSESA